MRVFSALALAAALLVSMPVLAAPNPNAPQVSKVSSLQPGRDYTIEGDIQTLWDNSFLLHDSSGEIVVELGQHSTYDIGLHARGYVQVSGHLVNSHFVPMTLAKPDGTTVMFTGTSQYAPLDTQTVLHNTNRWMLTNQQMSHMAGGKPADDAPAGSSTDAARAATTASRTPAPTPAARQ